MTKFYIVLFSFRVNYCMGNGNESINMDNDKTVFMLENFKI